MGTVYLRIYNSNPTFALEDPKRFTVDLLEFISSRQGNLVTASMFPTDLTTQGELALTSLAHVIRNNAGVEMQTIGHFKMLFSLLESQFSSVQDTAMKGVGDYVLGRDVVETYIPSVFEETRSQAVASDHLPVMATLNIR